MCGRARTQKELVHIKQGVDWGSSIVYGRPTCYPIDTGGDLVCTISWISMVGTASSSSGGGGIHAGANYNGAADDATVANGMDKQSAGAGVGVNLAGASDVTVCASLPKLTRVPAKKFKVDGFRMLKKKIRQVRLR